MGLTKIQLAALGAAYQSEDITKQYKTSTIASLYAKGLIEFNSLKKRPVLTNKGWELLPNRPGQTRYRRSR